MGSFRHGTLAVAGLFGLLAVQTGQALTISRCFEQHSLAGEYVSGVLCPQECQFASECSGNVQCVRADDCESTHRSGKGTITNTGSGATGGNATGSNASSHATGVCSKCHVFGCGACGSSSSTCAQCESGYDLTEGLCIWSDWTPWYVFLGVIVFFSIWVPLDFLVSHCRATTNFDAVRAGLRHRSRTKLRDRTKDGYPKYNLFRTKMHTEAVCGRGATLFLNWFFLVAAVSLWLMTLALALGPSAAEEAASSLKSDKLCFFIPEMTDTEILDLLDPQTQNTILVPELVFVPQNAKLWTGLSYAGSVLLSAIFLIYQRWLWKKMGKNERTIPDIHGFAVEASGFPIDAVDSHEITLFWHSVASHLGLSPDDIVEVSIAYNFVAEREQVWRLVDQHIHKAAKEFAVAHREKEGVEPTDAWQLETTETGADVGVKPFAGTPWVQAFAYVMLGTDFDLFGRRLRSWSPSMPPISPEEEAEVLARIKSSGQVIVVLRSKSLAKQLVATRTIPLLFRDQEITVLPVPEEPAGVRWESFGVPMCTRYLRLAFCILVLTSVMVLWTLLYWPWSAFSWRTIGSSAYVSYAANLMLGLVIALGNAIVGQTIVMLTDYFDFRYQNRAHMVYLLAIVPCVFINIFADLYVTMGTAMAVYNAHNATNVSWISYNGLRLVMSDLFDLLVPGYILLPYMGEPMMTVLLPYWISIWRVKRDTRITAEHSERLMEAPPADIINPPYCDIICATSTFMLTFLAPSSTHWKLYLALLFFAVFVYLINRVRILRWQSAAQFNTSDLHIAESYLWALPLALLAAVFGSHIGPQDRSGSIGAGVLAFILHCVFHFIFVRWVVPWSCGRSEKKNSARSYNELIGKLSAAATYRNTNPIEVLKNHSSEGSGSLVFFRPGKEYLQTDSSKNYKNDEPAMRYTHGLQQVATHAAQQAAHAAQHAAAATGQGFSSAAVATGKGFSTGVHAAQHAAAATGGAISKNRNKFGKATLFGQGAKPEASPARAASATYQVHEIP